MFPGVEHLALEQLLKLPFKEQAVWFLNGFWADGAEPMSAHAETVWRWHAEFVTLDKAAVAPGGTELDTIMSARFLECTEQTLTSRERKTALKEIDVNNDGKMAFVELLMHRFNRSPIRTLAGKQGNALEIAACRAVIDEALALLPEIEAKLEAQRAAKAGQARALAAATEAKADAEQALASQRAAEATLRAALEVLEQAKAELLAAAEELRQQEQAVTDEMARLERELVSASPVARGRAANQLNALRNEDPLPLRKAKITQGAALRKVQKDQATALRRADESAAVTAVCAAKLELLDGIERLEQQSALALAAAVSELEQKYTDMTARMQRAQAAVEELKHEECGLGAVWWMERELYEADESLPRAKQHYDHSAPFSFAPRAPACDEPPKTAPSHAVIAAMGCELSG